MHSTKLIQKRIRRRQARSTIARIAARLGTLVVRRRQQDLIPLAPFDDL